MNSNMNRTQNPDRSDHGRDANPANRDPITSEPGAHPVSTGVGAAAGGLAGAAIGAAAGPIGAAAGAVIGGVAGGYGGKAAGESIDPTEQDTYWQKNYPTRPYATSTVEYKQYQPAYRYGWESACRMRGRKFEEVEPSLAQNWNTAKSDSSLTWDKAKHAVRDAWDRITGARA